MCNSTNNNDTCEYLKEYQNFRESRPHWISVVFPLVAILLLGFVLSVPIFFLCECDCDWVYYLYLCLSGLLLLFASFLLVKCFIPYWTKIAELNDKYREKLMKLVEEHLELDQLSKKTEISILEKQARTNMDETAKDSDNKRALEIKKQEYKSHIADVSLEIVKALGQLNDKDKSAIINQIIRNLNQ